MHQDTDEGRLSRGYVQVYTGDGKGKTSAALGLALRASGHGMRTYIGQFMKGQHYGELEALRDHPLITIEQYGDVHCIRREEVTPEHVSQAQGGLELARKAMLSGQYAGEAVAACLSTGDVRALTGARRRFMREHGRIFWILRMMQHFWYRNDKRRESFVKICQDRDVQRLTWQSYMYKRVERASPVTHARIFFKDLAHLIGFKQA